MHTQLGTGPEIQTYSRQGGSILLEGLIAILIFSFGVLAIVGLQAAAAKTVTHAKARVDASFIANQRIGEMWINRSNLGTFAETDTPLKDPNERWLLPEGTRTTVVAGKIVTVTVQWKIPGDAAPHNFSVVAQINAND